MGERKAQRHRRILGHRRVEPLVDGDGVVEQRLRAEAVSDVGEGPRIPRRALDQLPERAATLRVQSQAAQRRGPRREQPRVREGIRARLLDLAEQGVALPGSLEQPEQAPAAEGVVGREPEEATHDRETVLIGARRAVGLVELLVDLRLVADEGATDDLELCGAGHPAQRLLPDERRGVGLSGAIQAAREREPLGGLQAAHQQLEQRAPIAPGGQLAGARGGRVVEVAALQAGAPDPLAHGEWQRGGHGALGLPGGAPRRERDLVGHAIRTPVGKKVIADTTLRTQRSSTGLSSRAEEAMT